jgi:hypothetical protein
VSYAESMAIRAVCSWLGLALAAAGHATRQRGRRRVAIALSGGAAGLGVLVWLNFGVFGHGSDQTFVNQREQFHYQLGARFFPELGYDGLYLASLAAQAESPQAPPPSPWIRNLRTYQVERVTLQDLAVIRARFEPARWRAFRADHDHYLRALSPQLLEETRLDHGFNPSPAWTFVARLFAAHLPATPISLGWLAMLDVALMTLAFACVFVSFGVHTGLLCVSLFGLTYGTRFVLQGAFLRLDWLAAVLVGLCLLRRERPAAAGAAFAYASAVRVFPVVFFVGAAATGVAQCLRRERPRWLPRMVAGFACAGLVTLAGGAAAGRGVGAWGEFAGKLELHQSIWAPTRVGLEMLVLYAPEATRSAVERRGLPLFEMPDREVAMARERDRRGLTLLLQLAMVPLLAAALWRAEPREGALLGLVALYAFTSSGTYYWVALCATPLARAPGSALAALAMSGPLYTLQTLAYPDDATTHLRYAAFSLALGPLLLLWTLSDAARWLRPRWRPRH